MSLSTWRVLLLLFIGQVIVFSGRYVFSFVQRKLNEIRDADLVVTRRDEFKTEEERAGDLSNSDTFTTLIRVQKERLKELAEDSAAKLLGLHEYLDSLVIPAQINMENVIVTLMSQFGLAKFAPATIFLPAKLRSKEVHGPGATGAFVRALSPTILAALSQSVHSISRQKEHSTYGPGSALYKARFESDSKDSNLYNLVRNPFVLDDGVREVLEELGLDKDDGDIIDSTPFPKPLLPLRLPGLHLGRVPGVRLNHTRKEMVINRIMCLVFNRLASNSYPDDLLVAEGGNPKTFECQLTKDSPVVTTPNELLEALLQNGHSIAGGFFTNITSFGVAFSVNDGKNQWKDVPLAFPIRTGIRKVTANMTVEMEEIAMLVPHSSFYVECKGPLVDFRLEFFQGVDGFTGWYNPDVVSKWWQNASKVTQQHGKWSTSEVLQAIRHSTYIMNVYNHIASKWNLPMGGYGYTGVCLDSVALIENSVKGSTSVFPILIGGGVKVELLNAFLCFRKALAAEPDSVECIDRVMRSVEEIPCDVLIEPKEIKNACERMLATIPEHTPFQVSQQAREDAKKVLQTVKEAPHVLGLST